MLASRGVHILRNRIIETEHLPARELVEKYRLGKILRRAEQLGELAPCGVSREGFVCIWHRGAGIQIGDAMRRAFARIEGNYLENASQGTDVHCDFGTVSGNKIIRSYIGMKAFHGSRGVLMVNNTIHAPGKYGILLRPGSNSHDARPGKDPPRRGTKTSSGVSP
ncbi:MAG: right-handed parallel beta-helix repeat-containing protein [Acidobacteria bacterium]|nr:right-handed parallel beta-helix repeat-containing protein [Acidobacteriota bacterium]